MFLQRTMRGNKLPDGMQRRTMRLQIRVDTDISQRWYHGMYRSVMPILFIDFYSFYQMLQDFSKAIYYIGKYILSTSEINGFE